MNIKNIIHERVPCWYELVWQELTKSIILRINTDFTNGVILIPKNSPVVLHKKKQFGFKQASFVFGEDMGFEKSLVFNREHEGFLEYSVPIVVIRKQTGKRCEWCRGSGYDKQMERTCMYCDGARIEMRTDYSRAYAVSASLSLLFFFFSYPEIETACSFTQLMTISTQTIAGPHGGSLSGEFSKDLANFLRLLPQQEMQEVVSVMKTVHEVMCGEMKSFYQYSFRAHLQNSGRLIVDCPGDACGIHPDVSYDIDGNGYKFNCHNTDNMLQQMTLLSALAMINTLARKMM